MKRRTLFCIVLMLVSLSGLLAACGEDEKDPAPPANLVITYEPQPATTLLPGCEATELESWLEVAGTLIYTFRDESIAAIDVEPGEMGTTLNRLIDLRDAISRQPTPECALQAQSEILIVIRHILTSFQRYSNGVLSKDELSDQVNEAVGQINSHVTTLLDTTTTDLKERLGQSG